MIRLFIFDMGGVLMRNFNILPEASERIGLDYNRLLEYIRDDLKPLMEGRLGAEEFWKNLSRSSGLKIDGEYWAELFNPGTDQETADLITELKKSCRTVCGTNTLAEHYDYHKTRGDYDIFDRVYASHIMGIAKPEPEFFKRILDAESVKPAEAVFTDDMAENVEAAAELGINSFLFRNAGELRKELNAAGIPGTELSRGDIRS